MPNQSLPFLAAALCVLAVPLAPARADDAPKDTRLSEAFWDEPAFGLRFRVPQDVTQTDYTQDGSLVIFDHPEGFRIRVFIRTSQKAFDLKKLQNRASDQFGYLHPQSYFIRKVIPPPPRMRGSAVLMTYRDKEDAPWKNWGQVFVAIDDFSFAVFQLDSSKEAFDSAFETLGQMVGSTHLISDLELRKKRAAMLNAGEAWRKTLAKIEPRPLPDQQWFRIVKDGQDIGYQQISTITDPDILKKDKLDPGTAVRIRARLASQGRVFDTAHSVYESGNRELEIWERTITMRRKDKQTQRTANWVDTGFRTGKLIQVTRHEPAKMGNVSDEQAAMAAGKKLQWPTPPRGYLSQVDLQRLMMYWPTLTKDTAFYAYDADAGDLALRTLQPRKLPDGVTVIALRPTPHAPAVNYIYDADGKLRRIEKHDGHQFIATSADRIAAIWGLER